MQQITFAVGLESEGIAMLYIGDAIQERINCLGLSRECVADMAFMETSDLSKIINNQIGFEEIDEFEITLLCSVLHCVPEFFSDPHVKEKDLLVSTMNRGLDSTESYNIKARIQDYIKDYVFVNEILAESN